MRNFMRIIGVAVGCCLLPSAGAHQQAAPGKVSPGIAESQREMQKWLSSSLASKGTTYTVQQCRADTQRWTEGEIQPDKDGSVSLAMRYVIVVNGQSRMMSSTTARTSLPQLRDRIHEMSVCTTVDPDFEKQFSTYSTMSRLYKEEEHGRYVYFMMRHGLMDKFIKEDAESNSK